MEAGKQEEEEEEEEDGASRIESSKQGSVPFPWSRQTETIILDRKVEMESMRAVAERF